MTAIVGLRKQVPLIDFAIEMLRFPSTIHSCIPLLCSYKCPRSYCRLTHDRHRDIPRLIHLQNKLKSEAITFLSAPKKRVSVRERKRKARRRRKNTAGRQHGVRRSRCCRSRYSVLEFGFPLDSFAYTHIDGFGGLVVSMLASGTQVFGFKPGRSRWIFTGVKILSMPSYGGEVKESVPCPSFAACKRT